ncbi:MAG: PQQ-like beta-propeller repeat protein [Ignavibacteriaceae bacterium]|nr:PQQ-like beta-propeller repeat protein [Ignavibacteriaceae bacterium]
MGKGIKRYYSIIIAAAVSLISFTLTTCNPTEPISPEPKPPGYQEDIPWPSLADSPWPMHHGNPQSNGRSKYLGPQLGILEWRIEIPSSELNSSSLTSPVIANDSTIIFISGNEPGDTNTFLYSVSSKGIVNWKFPIVGDSLIPDPFETHTPPIVNSQNNIYVFASNGYLYSINLRGGLNFRKYLNIGTLGRVNIGKDGNFYITGMDGILYCISPLGEVLWQVKYGNGFQGFTTGSITFSPDGKIIYVKGFKRFSMPVRGNTLSAIDINGGFLWSFDNGENISSFIPPTDFQGNIYLWTQEVSELPFFGLICLTFNGEIKYFNDDIVNSVGNDPAIDYDGNIFLANSEIVSLDYKGNERWRKLFYAPTSESSSAIVCDGAGNIYLTNDDGILLNIDNNGNLKWSLDMEGKCYTSPAINSDGRIYIGTVGVKNYFNCVK